MALGRADELDALEHAVASHPRLGAAAPIRARAATFGELALESLARRDEGARALALTLKTLERGARERVLLDAVIRDLLALATTTNDPAVSALFAAAAARLTRGPVTPSAWRDVPTDAPQKLTVGGEQAWVWEEPNNEGEGENALARHFERMYDEKLANQLAVGKTKLRPPTPHELARLHDAAALLEGALPELSPSVFSHVDVIAIIDAAEPTTSRIVDSCSWVQFPSTVFLSPRAFRDPLHTAEVLFHEATHHKHYDIRRSRTILAPTYEASRAARIVASWNPSAPDEDLARWPDDNRWPSGRAISAGHVYTYLALLFARFVERHRALSLGPLAPLRERARVVTERSRYLMAELAARAGADLGADGHELLALSSDCAARVDRFLTELERR